MSLTFSRRQRGYTLVEMITVVVIITILASIIVGRLQNGRDGINFQRGIQNIESAANKARNQAIQTGQTYELTYDRTNQSLKVAAYDEAQNSTGTSKTPTTSKSTTKSSNSQGATTDSSLGSGWSINEIRKIDGSTESDLTIKFYADGSAEEKSVEFMNSNAPVSLSVHQDGSIEVKRGALGDIKPKEWEAGNIEQRTQ